MSTLSRTNRFVGPYPIWVWRRSSSVNSGLFALSFFPIDYLVAARDLHAQHEFRTGPILRFPLSNCEFWIMTFIIEATKDDHHTADIRFSAIVAVILARKLAEDGFAVSIRAPGGRVYSADQFPLLLTSRSSKPQEIADGG